MKKNLFRSFVASILLAVTAIAHAGALTDYAENKVVDALIRAQAIGTPATWHVALYTTCPTDSTDRRPCPSV